VDAAQSHYALASRGRVEVIPGLAASSLLCHSFNLLWATALEWQAAGVIDYFLLHHDDVEVTTHGWLDLMVAEMRRVGAAVLSAVVAIKDDRGETSTAVETGDPWRPRKLTLRECWGLPGTFCAKDTPWPGLPLLVNTGLMLVDLARPEFRERSPSDPDGLFFHFNIGDRILVLPEGRYKAQVRPEDWNFSRLCHARGLPVYATHKVRCVHHGDRGHSNQPEEAGVGA
jgi:hypothetical protein